jgi:hypothetical protein
MSRVLLYMCIVYTTDSQYKFACHLRIKQSPGQGCKICPDVDVDINHILLLRAICYEIESEMTLSCDKKLLLHLDKYSRRPGFLPQVWMWGVTLRTHYFLT